MDIPLCQHVKMSGGRCGSPALAGQEYCHFHAGMHRTVPHSNLFVRLWNPGHESHPSYRYELPYLEDAESIQIGFMQVIHGVAQELLDPRRAKLILSALHGAAANLRQMNAAIAPNRAPAKKPPAGVTAANPKRDATNQAEG